MKKLSIIAVFTVLIAQYSIAYGYEPQINEPVLTVITQPDDPWPVNSSALSAYLTGPLGVHLNLSYDYLKYTRKFFHGFSGGLTIMVMDGITGGPHLTYSMMFGKYDHHLDVRLGAALPFDPDVTYINFIPVVSLAYRHQKPGSNRYFRAGINTSGIGIGIGTVINPKN